MSKAILSACLMLISGTAFAGHLNCYNANYNISVKGYFDTQSNTSSKLTVSIGWPELGQQEVFESPKVLAEGTHNNDSNVYSFLGVYSGGPFNVLITLDPSNGSLDSVRAFNRALVCK
ncbi:MAG TPA: hypothetical protein VIG33_18325 [Pseudobdellovibrionaceae bacterium]